MDFKRCASCGEIKDVEDFSKPRREYCKPCNNRRIKAWRDKKAAAVVRPPKVERTEKPCRRCQEIFPLAHFYKTGNWRSSYCRACSVLIAKARREKSPEGRRVEVLRYKTKRMGTTPEWFNETLTKQNGVCAICKTAETHPVKRGSKAVRSLAIDHDHITGKVRGLLCFRCNTSVHLLDKFGAEWLSDAAKYMGLCL